MIKWFKHMFAWLDLIAHPHQQIVIDTTALYGFGNEPSYEEMDKAFKKHRLRMLWHAIRVGGAG